MPWPGRELYSKALEKFGPKVVYSKSANNIARMTNFFRGHPKYGQMMSHLQKLPRNLLPKSGLAMAYPRESVSVARHFRKHVSLPLRKWNNTSKYVGSVIKQLNGRISVLKGVSRGATWYVPAALGIVSVATAPPEMRMRALFEEGFGIVGGALGAMVGSTAVASSVMGLMAFSGLCLGPFGAFVVIFILASAGGITGMESFKKFGGKLYDFTAPSGDDRIYHSPEQILGAFE